MNIVDIILIVFLIYFLLVGYLRGAIKQSIDLLVLIISLALSFLLYKPLGALISTQIKALPVGIANVVAFFVIWAVIELIYYLFFVIFYNKIPEETRESSLNSWLGLLPATIRAILSAWILIGLLVILPIPDSWHSVIKGSMLAKPLVQSSSIVEKSIGRVFGGSIDDTLKEFLTVKPESTETIDLGYKTTAVNVDPASEERMLELLNAERAKAGLSPLTLDDKLREVARSHSKDMFARGYFSHNTPDGLTPFDRMDQAGIKYTTAGENLALAPDTDIAHRGLMNSPGHKANILTPEFRKIGIGVIDGGKYGKIFSQEFTD